MKTNTTFNFCDISIAADRVAMVLISLRYSDIIFQEFTAEITRYMMPAVPSDIRNIRAFINTAVDDMKNNIDLTMAILKKDDDEFLGICGLHGKQNPAEPALGIWLKKSAHGNKYGQEAIKTLVAWARQNIDFRRMLYPCDRDNIASCKIAESLNGTIIRTGVIKSMSGRMLNEITYSIE